VYIYFVYTNIIYIFTPWEEITPILKLKIMKTLQQISNEITRQPKWLRLDF
jgi:hypothetical protein